MRSSYRALTVAAAGAVAMAMLPMTSATATASADFTVGTLTLETIAAVSTQSVTGDDRGGIAASGDSIFWTGDNGAVRLDNPGLGDMAAAGLSGSQGEGLTSDLETQTAYVFERDTGFLTSLRAVDPVTGDPTSTVITLSQGIQQVNTNCWAVGAGWGRTAIWGWCAGKAYDIDLPSGTVDVLSAALISDFAHPPVNDYYETSSFAQSGVVENVAGDLRFVLSTETEAACSWGIGALTRYFVLSGTGSEQTVLSFGDTCDIDLHDFTVSPQTGAWFTHTEESCHLVPECAGLVEPVISLRMSGASGAAAAKTTPIHQAVGKTGECDVANGWTASWQEWPNDGLGGEVCQRTLYWFKSLGDWAVAQLDPVTDNYVIWPDAKV